MGNKPPKPPPEQPPNEGGGDSQKPPPSGGGGSQKPPPSGGGGGSQKPPTSGGGGSQRPPPSGGGGGQKPPPSGEGQQPPDNQLPPSSGGSSPPRPPPNAGSGEQQPPPEEGEVGDSNGCSNCENGSGPQPSGPSHPLNQLNEDEIRQSVSLIKERAQSQRMEGDLIFASVSMKEPPKSELLLYFTTGAPPPPRKSWAVFSQDGINTAWEATVNLDSKQVEEFIQLPPGYQPSFNSDDPIIIQDVVRKDAAVIERATKAGVTNMDYLICDAWSYGYNNTVVDKQNLRLMDMYLYARQFDGDNQYAHPLDFLVTVDMTSKQVVDIVDLPVCPGNEPTSAERPIPPPQQPANYDPRVVPQSYYRTDVKPLEITQPKGPSFKIKGNQISWQKWEMNIGFNFREGLTLHNITFNDNDRKRSVLYRAAISEMVVPYGDPRVPFYRKSAFDLGEYGLGYNANSLINGCDCLGEIRYMDAVFANSKGEPFVTKSAICIHEEDAGLLQKHTEFRNGNVTVARSRKLVISFLATVTNYDYLYYWNFFQDGTMEVDIKATGLLSVHSLGLRESCGSGGYGNIMAPRLNAPYHQHIFCARLDPMIDGQNNTVAVQEVVPLEDPDKNPFGIGFTTMCTILEQAADSGTDTDPDKVRSWLIANEKVLHPYSNRPVAWKLVAPGFARILASPGSGVYQRAGFARHSVWVTPYKEDQLYAAGKYINQAPGGRDGVDVWAEQDENIRDTDIVVWHTFGLTHIPRIEDFPLMPSEGACFMLRPTNFFIQNPALDVPPPKKKNTLK